MQPTDRPSGRDGRGIAVIDAFDAGTALCVPFLRRLPVSGLSISVVSERGAQSTVGTSDLIAARLEELQFQLGEGPTPDALRTSVPVLAPDLHDHAVTAGWPVFTDAALDTGARGVFSLPLHIGHVTVGVVSLYALMLLPPWSDAEVDIAVGLAAEASRPAIELATRSASAETPPPGRRPTEMRREVHQAAGMLTVQLDCSIDEAMARLRAHAFSQDRPIDTVARDVVSGRLDFAVLDD